MKDPRRVTQSPRTRIVLVVAAFLLALAGTALQSAAQTTTPDVSSAPAINHNTWTSGALMPNALFQPVVGVLKGQIYVVGGYNGGSLSGTQIYNPVTNAWSTGVSLPVATNGASGAVVKNILYVIGGSNDGSQTQTNAVWAYNPKTKTWSPRAAMPTARQDAGLAVAKNILYVVGGYNKNAGGYIATVESYNPATDTWTEEAPLLVSQGGISAAAIGSKIVAADGWTNSGPTGDTEEYNVLTNAWTSLKADPTTRGYACAGAVGPLMYALGGSDPSHVGLSTAESFKPSKNVWTTLAAMPQAGFAPGCTAYKGQLYVFGGWVSFQGAVLNTVQIYQP